MWEYEVCMGYGCEVGGTGLGIGGGACVGCMG